MNSFYGKYRARVYSVDDPEERCRIKVTIPKLIGTGVANWCDPCIPVASDEDGDFYLPKVGETVWVEFEGGNINHPIWSGNWFSKKKSPLKDYSTAKETRVISMGDCRITMNEKTKKMTIKASETLIEIDGDTNRVSVDIDGVELVLNAETVGKLNQLISHSEEILTHITHTIY